MEEAARNFGQQVHVGNAASVDHFDRILAALVRLNPSALLVTADAVFLDRRDRLVGLVAHYALPALYPQRDFVPLGGTQPMLRNRIAKPAFTWGGYSRALCRQIYP